MGQYNQSFGNSFGTPSGFIDARAVALSAGSMSVAIRDEVTKLLNSHKNSVLHAIRQGLKELLNRSLITEKDLETLDNVTEIVFNVLRKKVDSETAFFQIRKTYADMTFDQACSPTALAILSVLSSSFDFEKSNSVNVTITPGNSSSGAVIGGIIGGVIGGVVGGGLGAGIGAAIGAAAGAAIGACNNA